MHRSHGIPGLLGGYEAESKMKRHLSVLLLAGLSFLQLGWLVKRDAERVRVIDGAGLRWMSEEAAGMPERDPRYPCGVVCVAVAGELLSKSVTLHDVREIVRPPIDGIVSLADVATACRAIGLQAIAAKLPPSKLPVGSQCIGHVRGDHFVVIRREHKECWLIIDVPFGVVRCTTQTATRVWDGTGVFIGQSDSDLRYLTESSGFNSI